MFYFTILYLSVKLYFSALLLFSYVDATLIFHITSINCRSLALNFVDIISVAIIMRLKVLLTDLISIIGQLRYGDLSIICQIPISVTSCQYSVFLCQNYVLNHEIYLLKLFNKVTCFLGKMLNLLLSCFAIHGGVCHWLQASCINHFLIRSHAVFISFL